MTKILPLLFVVFTFLGIIDAGFITYEKFAGRIPPCTIHFQCDKVLNSSWSMIGPVPISVLGMLFYSVFFVLSVLYFGEIKHLSFAGKNWEIMTILVILSYIGLGVSAFLVFLMAFVIQSWCLYCLLSAINCVVLFSLIQLFNYISKKQTQGLE